VRDSLYDSSDPQLNQPNKKHQPNFFTNIAYSSPDHEKRNVQPLLRFILHNCALDVKNNEVQWNSRINAFEAWTRYKTGDKDEMLLQDLINMDKVNMYAANDEWVTLPWYSTETNGQITNPYQKPRTGRYGNIQCRDFDWIEKEMNYNDSNKCSMYNEPIVFLRVLAIHDTGKQELISTDGRQLTVKSLIDKVAGSKYSRQDDFFGANDNYLMMNVRFREMKWNGVEQQGLYLSEIKLK
jgi:hypothetical protein